MKVGIDIGGSHISIGIIDGEKIIKKIEYVYDKNFKKQIGKNIPIYLENTLSEIIKNYPIKKIGISLAGFINNNTLVVSPNLPELQGINFVDILHSKFSIPINVNTDSLCAGRAEKEYGCLKPFSNGIFLVIGTGIGSVIFYNDNLHVNEYGHMIIKKDGNLCRCGKKGCFEAYASMKIFKEKIQKTFGLTNVSGKDIRNFLHQNKGNTEAEKIINEYVDDFCMGLSNIIDITLPKVIGFGGSFSYYEDILLEKIKQKLNNETLFIDKRNMPTLIMGKFKNDAGIIGSTLF